MGDRSRDTGDTLNELGATFRDMRRHGFTMLRRTTHGMLFGFKEFKMLVPEHMFAPWQRTKVLQDWAELREKVLQEYPGIRLTTTYRRGDVPADVDRMQPVLSPEERVQMEIDRNGTESRVAAEETQPVTPVVEASVEAEMPKRKKRINVPTETCCGRSFSSNQALAVHKTRAHSDRNWSSKKGAKVKAKPVRAQKPHDNGTKPMVKGQADKIFAEGLEFVQEGLRSLEKAYALIAHERDLYRKERDEVSEEFDKVRTVLGSFPHLSKKPMIRV